MTGSSPSQRYVTLDPERIRRRRLALNLSERDLIEAVPNDVRTVRGVIRDGKRCYHQTAKAVARVLQVGCVDDLIARPDNNDGDSDDPRQFGPTRFQRWEVEQVVSRWRTTSTGLQFCVCRMRDTLFRDVPARGKCYFLRDLSDEERERIRERLIRHADVCRRIGRHPRFPVFEHADFAGDDYFWVLERWEPGVTLSEVLRGGPLDQDRLPLVMRQIAEGLQVLHQHEIIRRELTPEFVTLRESDGSVLLSEFELAKLVDGSPTVSPYEADSPYLAPELGSRTGDDVDLFSWAQILFHAATGDPPPPVPPPDAFTKTSLPANVKKLAAKCVSVRHALRPQRIDDVLKAIRNWK